MIQRVPLDSLFLTSYGYCSYKDLLDKLILAISSAGSSCYLKPNIWECESTKPLQGYLLMSPSLDEQEVKLPNRKILYSGSHMILTVNNDIITGTVDDFYNSVHENSELEFVMAYNGIEAYKTPVSIGKAAYSKGYLEVNTLGDWVPYVKLPGDELGGLF